MAEPRRDPETGGRSLAEILREAGIESPTRGRRRRDDPDDTGIRQRGQEDPGDTGRVGGRPYGRRASDLRIAEPPAQRAADPSTAAIPNMRPSGKPEVPGAETSAVRERRPDERRPDERRPDDRRTERRPEDRRTERRPDERRAADRRATERRPDDRRAADRRRADVPVAEDRRVADRRQADRRLDDRRRPEGRRLAAEHLGEAAPVDRPLESRPVEARPERPAGDRRAAPAAAEERRRVPAPARPLDDNPVTGPIPIVTDDVEAEDLDSTPKESALAWLRFAGELVIALAAGVGIYFLFTVIWEMLPHLAVLVSPLAVTGLVAGVGAYRHKMHRDPVGPKLLAVLVFAGVLLTVAPAAGLLAAG
ncbi:DUF2157 domain-containing protein [Petropleomorpha daqingensis]|uniref:Uncharacterized protein n=1 Tax=Petropleomorpha daqingensis TaxID=2026353 RepID=A0A853CCZ4_9ACTN|nr:DUF2157 domain-containing protein [Petropleomorpha daqingensis]NYJ04906.1 hypothetical protein [Petropleomorpha daqingensis]